MTREPYLRMLESRPEVGNGRFVEVVRVNPEGGRGHWSLVFRARDTTTNRPVILKFYNPERQHEIYRLQCFEREATLLQRLANQADIIRIVCGKEQFTHLEKTHSGLDIPCQFAYYALEPAETDVAERIATDAWPPAKILMEFRGMCRAVRRAHANRVVHRDIKPDNFLVMADDSIRLSDFGAGTVVDEQTPRALTTYKAWPGALEYAAPEMLALLHDDMPEIAFRADIYSLGAVLFEMATGQRLGLQVFDWELLWNAMMHVSPAKRSGVFDGVIDRIVVSNPLPSIRSYDSRFPASILGRVDSLYQAMCHLNYRERLVDFDRIFPEINACEIILRNEGAYTRWRARRSTLRRGVPS